jgi:hypothetical protein
MRCFSYTSGKVLFYPSVEYMKLQANILNFLFGRSFTLHVNPSLINRVHYSYSMELFDPLRHFRLMRTPYNRNFGFKLPQETSNFFSPIQSKWIQHIFLLMILCYNIQTRSIFFFIPAGCSLVPVSAIALLDVN